MPSASSQTGYKWSFASKASNSDNAALRAARDEVGAATHNRASGSSGSGRLQGPTLPTAADLTLAREAADEHRSSERDYQRKRDRKEAKERLEEMVGPKPVGREGMLEKKRAQRENDRAFRERGDEGLELDESTLMGGGSSFKDECVAILLRLCWCGAESYCTVALLCWPGSPGETPHGGDSRRSGMVRGRTGWPQHASGRTRYDRRTRRRWTCSCRWRRRNLDEFVSVVVLFSPCCME